MKRLILCLLFPFCTFSQDIYFDEPYAILKEIEGSFSYMRFSSYFYDDWEQEKAIKKAGVKEIKLHRIDKKGKIHNSTKQYNQAGRFIYGLHEDSKIEEKKEYLYDTLQTYRSLKTKKHFTEYKTTYTDTKKSKQQKWKNGKLVHEVSFNYTSFGKIASSCVTKKGKNYEMHYEYNAENKLEKSTYLVNGKVKRVWNHSCKPEGETAKNPKVEVLSSACVYREENNDGSYAIFERTIRDNKPHLIKKSYTKDSLLIGTYSYVKDSILYKAVVTDGKCSVESNYKTKNQKIYKQVKYCYQNKYINEYQWIKRGKLKYRTTWERNENGFATTIKHFNKNQLEPSSITTNSTNDKNLLTESSYQRKSKTYHKTTMEYLYY